MICSCINIKHEPNPGCRHEAKLKCPECGAALCIGCAKRHHFHQFDTKDEENRLK